MLPSSISATSIQVFESCQSRWRAEFFEKTPTLSGSAANLGTAVHGALEGFVKAGKHKPKQGFGELKAYYDIEYWKVFADEERYTEGLGLLDTWYQRTEFPESIHVASTETKENFLVKADGHEVVFNFIWDRCDILTNSDGTFDVEVLDYKTVGQPIQPEDLKKKIQARSYALAAAIKYPQARYIWITYDLLRYDKIGVRFTREENIETYRFLQAALRRIIASDGTKETLNPECRWCIRKPVCETLHKHIAAGGVLGLTDPDQVADLRAQNEYTIKALETLNKELDEFLLRHLEETEQLEFRTGSTVVSGTMSSRRGVDPHRVARVIGSEMMSEYGSMKMGDFDRLMKDNRLTDEQKSELKQLVGKNYGAPGIKIKPIAPIGEDE